jgi:hypothetical protein
MWSSNLYPAMSGAMTRFFSLEELEHIVSASTVGMGRVVRMVAVECYERCQSGL